MFHGADMLKSYMGIVLERTEQLWFYERSDYDLSTIPHTIDIRWISRLKSICSVQKLFFCFFFVQNHSIQKEQGNGLQFPICVFLCPEIR